MSPPYLLLVLLVPKIHLGICSITILPLLARHPLLYYVMRFHTKVDEAMIVLPSLHVHVIARSVYQCLPSAKKNKV